LIGGTEATGHEAEAKFQKKGHEAVALTLDHLQQREGHWAIVDLVSREATFERFRFPIG